MITRRFSSTREAYVLGTDTGGKTWTIFRGSEIVATLECSQEMAQEIRNALNFASAAIRVRKSRQRVPAIPKGKVPKRLTRQLPGCLCEIHKSLN